MNPLRDEVGFFLIEPNGDTPSNNPDRWANRVVNFVITTHQVFNSGQGKDNGGKVWDYDWGTRFRFREGKYELERLKQTVKRIKEILKDEG